MAEPSPNRQRAQRLFNAAAIGGHAMALIVVPLLWLLRGPAGGISALVTALGALAFLGLGQLVQVVMADSSPRRLFAATMASYVVRVSVPLLVVLVAGARPERLAGIDRTAVAVTVIAVAAGWLTAEMLTFRKLRIPVFDDPRPPSS